MVGKEEKCEGCVRSVTPVAVAVFRMGTRRFIDGSLQDRSHDAADLFIINPARDDLET